MKSYSSDIDARVKEQIACGGSLATRRVVAVFVAGMRGHYVTMKDFEVKAVGLVASCRRCKAKVTVPRERRGTAGVEGLVVEKDCARRPR